MKLGRCKVVATKIEGPLRLTVEYAAPYVDEKVYKDAQLYCAKEPLIGKTLSHYRRVPLNWLKVPR